MAVGYGKWAQEWKKSKKYFETESGKKKPTEKFLGFFRKSSGVSSAFEALDKSYGKLGKATFKAPERAAAIKNFEAQIKATKKVTDDYIDKLIKTAAADKKAAKTTDAKKKANDLQALYAILSSTFDICLVSAEGALAGLIDLWENEDKSILQRSMTVKQLRAKLHAPIKLAAQWIAKQERKPDVAEFNKGILKATRDITVNLENLKRFYPTNSAEYKAISKISKPLDDWAHADKRLKGATGHDVLVETLRLKRQIAAIAKWFNDTK
ncbi:hypothetical protein [Roseibium algae]|uniref:Uncharacterized protein n=1 Tax=Roseibium algae TaxID=3123038 RepID=A0ABU8TRB1_9HYPH